MTIPVRHGASRSRDGRAAASCRGLSNESVRYRKGWPGGGVWRPTSGPGSACVRARCSRFRPAISTRQRTSSTSFGNCDHPRSARPRAAKGGKSRTVPLPDEVRAAVSTHRRSFPSVRVRLPWLEPGGRTVEVELLLSNERGEPHSGEHFNKVMWRGAFRAAGLAYAPRTDGMHALRHFYASTLLAGGVSIKEVAEYLGHTDPGFTLRTYTHLVPSSHARARQAVDAVLRAGADASNGLRTA